MALWSGLQRHDCEGGSSSPEQLSFNIVHFVMSNNDPVSRKSYNRTSVISKDCRGFYIFCRAKLFKVMGSIPDEAKPNGK